MSGTRSGGLKARDKNKELYGNDWYSKIGKIGGKKCGMKGFALNPQLAREAGRKGGLVSKKGKTQRKDTDTIELLKSENAYLRGKVEAYGKFLKDKGYIKEEE